MDPSDKTQARVIVTRPVAQSDRLSALVHDAGGTAIRIPALEIRSTDSAEVAKEVFARIRDFQKVLFISPNAVRHSLQFITADTLEQHQCVAIGASTAQAMSQAGIQCTAHPENNFTSEALLELPELQDVSNENILIIRGNGGRALLGNELTNRGATIAYAEVYQRQIPEQSTKLLNDLLEHQGADVVIANSGETLSNIISIVDSNLHNELFKLQVVTGSARVAQAAMTAGFIKQPLVADTPDDQALMRAILKWPGDTPAQNKERGAAAPDEEITDGQVTADTDAHNTKSERPAPLATVENDVDKETTMTDKPNEDPTKSDNGDAMFARPSDQDDAELEDTKTASAEKVVSPEADQATVKPAPITAAPVPAAAKRGGAGIAWLALLMALLAAAGTAWNWWQSDTQTVTQQETFDVASLDIPSRDDIQNQIKELTQSQSGRITQQLDRYGNTIETVQDEQSNLASQVRTQKRSVDNLTEELTRMSDSISAMRGVSASVRNTWVRAETEYFLQTANTRLQLAGDIKSATQALKAADERIVALGDPSLTPVRAQLSEDLLALESLPHIDLEGIALSLNSLAARISKLPLRNQAASTFTRETAGESEDNSEESAWTNVKSAFSDTVGSFIRVSPTEDAGAVLLAPEQSYFLYRNLELQLQAARIAALQSRQAVYDDSLASSKAWIEEYFDIEDSGVETVLGRIINLQEKTVSHELPDISRSLNLIRSVVPARRTSGSGASNAAPASPPAQSTQPAASNSDEPES